ncbi:hypothetical protein [Serratia sp. (in: enterobacteria)]|uniref:hypothetical protein n=1 Tax=Serratia sp. (in: enterobacteria) TaxID=616 RepID=UPI00289BC0BD|nr:hypothetical protein [Serratia sp. (in: enterobacteria)]
MSDQIDNQVESFEQLRTVIPSATGDRILLKSWLPGLRFGGGEFVATIGDGVDDNGFIAAGQGFYWTRVNQTLDVENFGAKPGDWQFDNTVAFQSAINAAKKNGGGEVLCMGNVYRFGFYSYSAKYTLPFDDGTAAPAIIAMGKDKDICPEPQETMNAVLEIPSRVQLRGSKQVNTILDFGWSRDVHGVGLDQRIGILFRPDGYPTTTRMTGFVRAVGVADLTIQNAFIGILSDGVIFDQSHFGDMIYRNCGIPVLLQGADSCFFGIQTMDNCMAAFIVGGMWLQRNNVQYGGQWVPPYTTMDIWSLGWCDYCVWKYITVGNGSNNKFGDKHFELDKFFDDYFYKSKNSVKTSEGGRLTNMDQYGADTDNPHEKYRGICHRAWINYSRYNRGNLSVIIENAKTYWTSRVPFQAPTKTGTDYYGQIHNAYIEQAGHINNSADNSDANDWYHAKVDPYNQDYDKLPYFVVEGSMGCSRGANINTRYALTARSGEVNNAKQINQIWVQDFDEVYKQQPKENDNCIRYTIVYDGNAKKGQIVERMWVDRLETQPLAWVHGEDMDQTHTFRYRVLVTTLQMRNGNTTEGQIATPCSIIHTAGRNKVFLKVTIPANAASLTGDLNWMWMPKYLEGQNYGSDQPILSVISANVMSTKTYPVTGGGGGTVSIPKEIKSATYRNGALFIHDSQNPTDANRMKISDFQPGSVLEIAAEVNGNWVMY